VAARDVLRLKRESLGGVELVELAGRGWKVTSTDAGQSPAVIVLQYRSGAGEM